MSDVMRIELNCGKWEVSVSGLTYDEAIMVIRGCRDGWFRVSGKEYEPVGNTGLTLKQICGLPSVYAGEYEVAR